MSPHAMCGKYIVEVGVEPYATKINDYEETTASCVLERRLMQVEHVDQADPSRTINAANDGCVGAGR
jgi:hypothetical protein